MDQNPEVTDSTVIRTSEKKPYPGFLQAVLLLIILNIIVAVIMFFCAFAGIIARVPLHEDPVMRIIAYACALFLILWLSIENANTEFKELFQFRRIRATLLLPLTIAIIGVELLVLLANSLVAKLLPGSEFITNAFQDFIRDHVYLAVAYMVVIGPLAEELLFRGVILRGFLKRYTTTKAILLSALLFAASHSIVFQVMPAFFLGILLAWWFVKTRSLVPCIFGHVFNNALVLCVVFLLVGLGHLSTDMGGVEVDVLWLLAPGIVLLGLGIWLSKRMFTMEVKAN